MLAHILCILAQNLTTGIILDFHLQVPIATTTDIVSQNGTIVKMSRFMVIGMIIAAKFSMYVNLIKTA